MAMMRPRGGGGTGARKRVDSRGSIRQVYEDFNPMSEWRQTDDSYILDIYVPGFMKEQIKVSTEGQNKIAIHGERIIAGSTWSRFHNEFQVPGDTNSLQVTYREGTLTIKIPKQENPNSKPTSLDADTYQASSLYDEAAAHHAKRNNGEKKDNNSTERYSVKEETWEENACNKTMLEQDRASDTPKKMAVKECGEFSKERQLSVKITVVMVVTIMVVTAHAMYKFATQRAM